MNRTLRIARREYAAQVRTKGFLIGLALAPVLACGGLSDSGLYQSLKGKVDELHILGDAYAPRRIWFATRQAYALAATI